MGFDFIFTAKVVFVFEILSYILYEIGYITNFFIVR